MNTTTGSLLPKPFCRLEDTAYFLDLTFNQVEKLWQTEQLPRAVAQNGSLWMPGGRRLVQAAALLPILDAEGAELFELWQRDELRISAHASGDGNKTTRVRLLDDAPPPPHGTTARYARQCRCDDCSAAHSAYMRQYKAARKAAE